MKIYLGNNKPITDKKQITQSDIQLAYYKEAEHKVESLIRYNDQFNEKSKTKLYPFQKIDSKNISLFDEDEELISNEMKNNILRYKNQKYYFNPINSVEYVPTSFSYRFLLKKNDIFKNNVDYKISFKTYGYDYNITGNSDYINNGESSIIPYSLTSIFCENSLYRPSNIIINNGSENVYSTLVSGGLTESKNIDFLVASYKNYKNGDSFILNSFDKHTNLWLLDESFDGAIQTPYTGYYYIEEDMTEPITIPCQEFELGQNDISVWLNDTELELSKGHYTETYIAAEQYPEEDNTIGNAFVLNAEGKKGDIVKYRIKTQKENTIYTIGSSIFSPIFKSKSYDIVGYDSEYFNIQNLNETFSESEYYYNDLFIEECPVMILHNPGIGYIILSKPELLEYAEENANLIFEIMMYIYLNAYFETDGRSQYIASERIDYYINMNKDFGEYHPRINLNNILFKDEYNVKIEYDIYDTIIDIKDNVANEDIIYLGQDKFNNALFKLISPHEDSKVIKDKNEVSLFTTNDTIINYNKKSNVIFLIEEIPEVYYKQINGINKIYVNPFRSSKHNIYIPTKRIIQTDINNEPIKIGIEYIIYYDYTLKDICVAESIGNRFSDDNKIEIATILLSSENKISCGDIRQWGGGEIDASTNYEMIDTGSLSGRPYRKGSIMVIRMSSEYEKYKDILKSEIMKHMSSADYPILIFEDKMGK